ncbi:MAG: transposase [Methanosarcinales archaeon Met12]|nr:MAG: transposase [Methanosarcinales archaeon Met12]
MLRGRGVRPLIKHREFKPYDRAANARMDKELYGQRNMAETANSVIKRRYGDHVRSRKCHHQFREIIGKCIVYNIERAIKSLVLNIQAIIQKLFYKA